MLQARGRAALFASLTVLAVAPGTAPAETISGHVLEPSGAPVTSEPICIRPGLGPMGMSFPGATTSSPASGGAYSLDVTPGTYNITFADCQYSSARDDALTYYGPTGALADAMTGDGLRPATTSPGSTSGCGRART